MCAAKPAPQKRIERYQPDRDLQGVGKQYYKKMVKCLKQRGLYCQEKQEMLIAAAKSWHGFMSCQDAVSNLTPLDERYSDIMQSAKTHHSFFMRWCRMLGLQALEDGSFSAPTKGKGGGKMEQDVEGQLNMFFDD